MLEVRQTVGDRSAAGAVGSRGAAGSKILTAEASAPSQEATSYTKLKIRPNAKITIEDTVKQIIAFLKRLDEYQNE